MWHLGVSQPLRGHERECEGLPGRVGLGAGWSGAVVLACARLHGAAAAAGSPPAAGRGLPGRARGGWPLRTAASCSENFTWYCVVKIGSVEKGLRHEKIYQETYAAGHAEKYKLRLKRRVSLPRSILHPGLPSAAGSVPVRGS